MIQIVALIYSILLTFIATHPSTTLILITIEIIDSLIASELKMPNEKSSKLYQVLFIVMTSLAINRARVAAALRFISLARFASRSEE